MKKALTIILVLALAVCLFIGITDSIRKKALAAIDEIEYK